MDYTPYRGTSLAVFLGRSRSCSAITSVQQLCHFPLRTAQRCYSRASLFPFAITLVKKHSFCQL